MERLAADLTAPLNLAQIVAPGIITASKALGSIALPPATGYMPAVSSAKRQFDLFLKIAQALFAPGTFSGDLMLVVEDTETPEAANAARRLVEHRIAWRPDTSIAGGRAMDWVLKARAAADKKTLKETRTLMLVNALLDAAQEVKEQESYKSLPLEDLFAQLSQRAVAIVERRLLQTKVTGNGLLLLPEVGVHVPRRGRPKGSIVLPDFSRRYLEVYKRCAEQNDQRPAVNDVAAELGISKPTFYRYLALFKLKWPPS